MYACMHVYAYVWIYAATRDNDTTYGHVHNLHVVLFARLVYKFMFYHFIFSVYFMQIRNDFKKTYYIYIYHSPYFESMILA